jgi:beta-galactosidase
MKLVMQQKSMKFREVIQNHLPAGQKLPDVPQAKPTIAIPSIKFTQASSIFDVLPAPKSNASPLTFEDLNQAYGFVLYRITLNDAASGLLKINDLRDYAIIFVNGKRVRVLDRRLNQDSLQVDIPKGKVTLDTLVENLGRINFGKYLLQNKKGITEEVLLNDKELRVGACTVFLLITLILLSLKAISLIQLHLLLGRVPLI